MMEIADELGKLGIEEGRDVNLKELKIYIHMGQDAVISCAFSHRLGLRGKTLLCIMGPSCGIVYQ